MERIITWLHLSDLHALSPKHAWEPDFILSELVASLRVFRKRSISPDFIFFSGDLAFGNFSTNPGSSMEDQYHKFDSFFDSVREVFPDVPDQNVFFVPGNHDVDRSEVAVDQQQWLMNSANIEDINNLLQSKDKQFGRLMLRLKEYRQYLESSKYTHLLGDPDRLIYSTKRSIQGIDLGIAGFNSAWASGEDGEKGKLWTGGLWQINNLYNSLSSADLRLALIHHPANWFVEKEDKPFWDTLRSRFHFCLNGHEHSPGVETPVPDFLRIMASACYNRADRLNGYNMTQLNLSTNQACITLLRYDDMGGGWVPHIISGRSTNDGECIIDNVQFLNRLRRRRVFQVPSDMSAGPPPRQPATIPIIQAEPAHLASSIAPSSLRRPPKSGSIWDYIRNICIVEQIDYNQIITRNAIDEEGWESSLFIEPGKYIYQHDYVWDSIKKREPGRILSDHTNSEELLALTRDGKRKGIFLMGDIACGKTTFVTRFSKLYCDTIPQAFCLLEDFSKWRNRINSEEAFQGMMKEFYRKFIFDCEEKINMELKPADFCEYIVRNSKTEEFKDYKQAMDAGQAWAVDTVTKSIEKWKRNNTFNYSVLLLRCLKKSQFKPLIIVDNVDPIPICYQERFAQEMLELAHYGRGQVIIPLRFYSYESMSHVVGVYRWCYFMKLDLPSIHQLIEKRLKYFLFDKLRKRTYTIPWKNISVTIDKDTLVDLIAYVNEELLQTNTIKSFIAMSDMSIKYILMNYRSLLCSRHIELGPHVVHKFFTAEQKRKKKTKSKLFNVPSYDLLLKSIISEHRILYQHNRSRVENLFRVYSPNQSYYYPELIKLYLLEILYRTSVVRVGNKIERQFVKTDIIKKYSSVLGWDMNITHLAMGEMFYKALIFGYESNEYSYNTKIALSNLGLQYRDRVCRMIYYMFFMAFDFPLKRTRMEKYFDIKKPNELEDEKYYLRKQYTPLLGDKFMHIMAGEFLVEFSKIEVQFLYGVLSHPQKNKVFWDSVRKPIYIRLIESYIAHCTGARGRLLSDLIQEMEDLRAVYQGNGGGK